jgi:hypothetical protein
MTCKRLCHSVPGKRTLRRAVGLVLIVAILTVQTPATPRSVSEMASEIRSDLTFWFHSSGLAATLNHLISGQSSSQQPETQSDRDARVANVNIIPGDLTIKLGEKAFFDALAHDNNAEQVGGVRFTWRAENAATNSQVRISQTGEFIGPAPGSYRVSAESAGETAQVIVTVLQESFGPPRGTKPISVQEVSSRNPISSAPGNPQEPNIIGDDEPGPPWGPGNFPAAHDPDNDRGDPPGRPKHHGSGSGNFQISAPVLSLPGRGIDLSLGLTYNSRVWTLSNSNISYNIDKDWPTVGWSLGFGRVIGLGTAGAMLVEADGTRHGFSGTVTTYPAGNISFTGHTIDGTFIDYSSLTDSTGTITSAQAKLPNGTIITYGAPGRGAVFPLRITDPNGNFISIQYKTTNGLPSGPKLSLVTDTLGRTVNFYYDGTKLTAITAPGIDGLERQLVRFHYKTLTLNYAFSATLTPQVGDPAPRVLDAIYYPGTGTGYWFGDADSYSPYGMLAKYSEQRGMTFSPPGLNVEGTVTAGTITRQSAYNYQMAPDNTLTDAPTYSTMTETWDGMDTDPAVTTYLLQKNATTRFATITFPDLSKSIQYSFKAPNQYNDGYIFQDETYDSAGVLLRKSTVTWAMGDYGSARPVRIEATDKLNQTTAAEFDYAPAPAYNSVTDVRDFDYGGTNRLRTTRVLYRNSVEYTGRHIFNLVKRVDVWDATDTIRMSRILYEHDGAALVNAPNVVQHDPAYDPNTPPVCHWEDDPNDPDCWGGCFATFLVAMESATRYGCAAEGMIQRPTIVAT